MNVTHNVRSFGAKGDGVTNDRPVIQAAIDALPAAGGVIYFPPGTYLINTSLTMPDKPVVFQGEGASSTITLLANVIYAFTVPTGLTAIRQYEFIDLRITATATAGSGVWTVGDVENRGRVRAVRVNVDSIETIWRSTARQGAYVDRLTVNFFQCKFKPPGLANTMLLKTEVAAGSFASASEAHLLEVDATDDANNNGFSVDFDGDLFVTDTVWRIRGTSGCDGLAVENSTLFRAASGTPAFRSYGGNYWLGTCTLTGSDFAITLTATAVLAMEGCRNSGFGSVVLDHDAATSANSAKIVGCNFFATGGVPAVLIDIPAGKDNAQIIGCHFSNAPGTAAIRNAASRVTVDGCQFGQQTTGKTILEVGAANNNKYDGNNGLNSGTGITILGLNTRISEENYRNVRDFGAVGDGATNDQAAIQAAIDALPAAGGTVYFPPGTYLVTDTLAWGDKDITFNFSTGAKIITTGLGAKPLFKCNTGLTALRKAIFWNPECVGENSAAAQYFLELADVNSRCWPEIYTPNITGFRRIFNISAGDVAYITPQVIRIDEGRIIPPNATSILVVTPNVAGTYAFGTSVFFTGCLLADLSDLTLGWTLDLDGDLILNATFLRCTGTGKIDGLNTSGDATVSGPGGTSLEMFGTNYLANDDISNVNIGLTLKLSGAAGTSAKVSGGLIFGGSIILNGPGHVVSVRQIPFGSIAAIAVDILAGADYAEVDGVFLDCATSAIRTAADKGSFRGTFQPTGAHKAITELTGADFNIAAGCSGLGVAAANVVIVGAASRYDVTLANTV